MPNMPHELPTLIDDNLITEEIGDWGREKYRLLNLYGQLFSASMKNKWECRVYIDLFAGSGRSRIKGTSRIVAGSPLIALGVDPVFDKYILCEKDADKLRVLQTRVSRDHPNAKVEFQSGDANEHVDQIIKKIPQHDKDFKVLSFCFVDPYNLKDLAFRTIDRLSARFVDFLVLIATDMDAARNVSTYEVSHNTVVERFLGLPDWRVQWRVAESNRESFSSYLMKRFSDQMEARRYIRVPIAQTRLVRSTEKNLPLYRLALFSRSERGKSHWEQALKYSDDQLGFRFPN
jgi:three-Cys-motif partner protein